jgi:hypothetical protein
MRFGRMKRGGGGDVFGALKRARLGIGLARGNPGGITMGAFSLFHIVILLIALVLLGGGYFLPAVVAFLRRHHKRSAILVLNLLLGWTCIGWIIALVWACTAVQPKPAA